MQVKRIQISHYGPIDKLDISVPISNEVPHPILLVGMNGTGKTIVLSHIVNGLISAKSIAYPDTPEITKDKVYKARSSQYITLNNQYYFLRLIFKKIILSVNFTLKVGEIAISR